MRTDDKQPDADGYYHFENFAELERWIESLPEEGSDPNAHCGPTKRRVGVRWVLICSGTCDGGGHCKTLLKVEGNRIAVKCHCQ